MRPAVGRFFTAADAPQGANPFAVLELRLLAVALRRRLVGRRTDDAASTAPASPIVGVAPRGFKGLRTFGFWPEIWVPVGMHDVVIPGSTQCSQGRGGG